MAYSLDKVLNYYVDVVEKQFKLNIRNKPMSGSGGGIISAAELFVNVQTKYGINFVLEKLNMKEKLKGIDLVITGEGQLDEQTIYNKAPFGIAKLAKDFDIPVICISATLGSGYEKFFDNYIDVVASISGKENWCQGIANEDDIVIATEDIVKQYLVHSHGKQRIKGMICKKS